MIARMRFDGRERTWSIPLNYAQWRALVKLRPRMTLGFLLASGPGCLGPMLDFLDSLGRRRPIYRVDRLGESLQVYATMGVPVGPDAHERAVRGSDRFTARYRFEFGEVEYAPGDSGPDEWLLTVTEEGRFLHVPESKDHRTIRRLAGAVGFGIPPGLARRMARRLPEIPWTSLRAPWPLFTRWLDDRRPRIVRLVLRSRSVPREAIPGLVEAGAELEVGREAQVVMGRRALVARVMEALGPCLASFALERRPGDERRRGFVHVGRLRGTDREVAYDDRVHGE